MKKEIMLIMILLVIIIAGFFIIRLYFQEPNILPEIIIDNQSEINCRGWAIDSCETLNKLPEWWNKEFNVWDTDGEIKNLSCSDLTNINDCSFIENLSGEININININKSLVKSSFKENKYSWNREVVGTIDIINNGIEEDRSYFLPGIFGCIRNEDKPLYLSYFFKESYYSPSGIKEFLSYQSPERTELNIVLLSSEEYLRGFIYYPNLWSDYESKDYDETGFIIGDPKEILLYSYEREKSSNPNCKKLNSSEFKKLVAIALN